VRQLDKAALLLIVILYFALGTADYRYEIELEIARAAAAP
jgi:hypothetical protein